MNTCLLLARLTLCLVLATAAFHSAPAGDDAGAAAPAGASSKSRTLEPRLVGCCMPRPNDDRPVRKELMPLRHTDVSGRITGMIAEVTVKQEFFNPLTDRLEAVYVFPLPENAAVHNLKITIKDRTIIGEIKTTEAARATYNEAREAGQTAALVEQSRDNIFTASVANIPPSETVLVEITYYQTLNYDDGRYTFAFPMVVAPRYMQPGEPTVTGPMPMPAPVITPALPDGPGAQADQTKPTPPTTPAPAGPVVSQPAPVATPQPAPAPGVMVVDTTPAPRIQPGGFLNPRDKRIGNISLHLTIDAGVGIASVTCPTHEVTVKQTGNSTATVDLTRKDEIPNKDFVLEYKVTGAAVQAAILAHKPKGSDVGYFLLMLVPKEEYDSEEILQKEMYYIIDHSGSMRGEKMDQAKLALKSSLHQLNSHDTFTVVPFDSNFHTFSETPVAFDQQNLDRADGFVAALQANSGTEILKPMDWALGRPADPERLKIVVFLTDGEVSNDVEVVKNTQQKAGASRVYTFGIGHSVNRWMLRKMAEYGHGGFETILPGENMGEKIARFNDRTSYPVLRDVTVNYGGLEVKDSYPAAMPDLFTAQPIVILGTYTKGGAYTIQVGGKTANGLYSNDLKVTLPDESDANAGLPVVWARARVEDLNDQLRKATDPKALQNQIRDLGLKFSLVTDYTSFVVVEKRQVEKEGKLVTEEVQVPLPEGWAEADGDLVEGKDGAPARKDATGMARPGQDAKGGYPYGGASGAGGGGNGLRVQPGSAPAGPITGSAMPPAPAAPPAAMAPKPAPQMDQQAAAQGVLAPGVAAAGDDANAQAALKKDKAITDATANELAKQVESLRDRRKNADGPAGNADMLKKVEAEKAATDEYLGDREITDDQSEMLADVLRALAREQDADGLWKDAAHDKSTFTALERSTIAILCYHRAGYTTKRGKFRAQMERAVEALIKGQQADGSYLLEAEGGVRLQAEAALTLVEIAGARNKEAYKAAAIKALDALVKHQLADGLFPATAKGAGDKIATAFALEALHRAAALNLGAYAVPMASAEKALGVKADELLKELARSSIKANTENASSLDRITGMAFYLTFGE